MSAHGRKVPIATPLMGVRKDVDPIAQTEDMLHTGINVVTTGGSVRPRCCHTREGFGQITSDWVKLYSLAKLLTVWDDYMVAWEPDGGWAKSLDNGATWSPAFATGSLAGKTPAYIFSFGAARGAPIMWVWDTTGIIHRVDMAGFAGTMTGVELGTPVRYVPTKAVIQPPSIDDKDRVFYDQATDSLWWMPLGDGFNPVCLCHNATLTTKIADFNDNFTNSSGVNINPAAVDGRFKPWYTDTYTLVGCGRCSTNINGSLEPVAVLTEKANPRKVIIIDEAITDVEYTAFNASHSFTMDLPVEHATVTVVPGEDHGICEMLLWDRLTQRDLNTDTDTLVTDVYTQNSFRRYVRSIDYPDNVALVGDVHIVTDDGGTTWTPYESPPVALWNIRDIYTQRVGVNNYYFLHAAGFVWASPVNAILAGTVSPDGDVTGIFQCSLDLEDFAFFTGTTTRMRHLDRLAEVWEDITNPAFAPNGTLGINPWVFRTFEKGGDRYMIAVNGEVTPQCYESGYTMMRALGDVDQDDAWAGDEEEPPTAHCLAVSNNRLVLGVRPNHLYFSRPNNFDIGYNDFEVRLNDTEGELICLNEIGASQLVAFKTDAIYHGTSQVAFMGTSAPMNFKRVRKGIVGPCSPQSVSYLPDGRLIYLGRDGGVYIYDAVAPVDAGRHIRAIIRDQIDPDRYGQAWSMVDTKRMLAYFFYPTTDGLMNRAVVMAMDMGQPWPAWEFTLPETWQVTAGMNAYFKSSSMLGSFPGQKLYSFPGRTLGSFTSGGRYGMVTVRRDGTWYRQEWDNPPSGDYTDAGMLIPFRWRHGWTNYDGDNSTREILHEIHHVAELNGVSIKVTQHCEQANGSVKIHDDVLAPGMDRLRTTSRTSGRRHALEFSGNCDSIFYWAQATAVPIGRGNR